MITAIWDQSLVVLGEAINVCQDLWHVVVVHAIIPV